MAEVLDHDGDNIQDYLQVFQKLFPPGAGYVHDKLHLRTELSDEQRASEPRNADSHLTFMGGGLRNCVSYAQQGDEPVWFVELDGVHVGGTRQRRTTVIAYNREEDVVRMQVELPASSHSIDAQNLRDPRLGFIDQLQSLARRHAVTFGRFDVSLPAEERHAGLTVNEYETLLMNHDLREVLGNPLRFMVQMGKMGREALQAPLTIPARALNYAQYDAVQLFNELMDRVGVRRSVVERLGEPRAGSSRLSLPAHETGNQPADSGPQRRRVRRDRLGRLPEPDPGPVEGAPPDPARALNVRLVRFV